MNYGGAAVGLGPGVFRQTATALPSGAFRSAPGFDRRPSFFENTVETMR